MEYSDAIPLLWWLTWNGWKLKTNRHPPRSKARTLSEIGTRNASQQRCMRRDFTCHVRYEKTVQYTNHSYTSFNNNQSYPLDSWHSQTDSSKPAICRFPPIGSCSHQKTENIKKTAIPNRFNRLRPSLRMLSARHFRYVHACIIKSIRVCAPLNVCISAFCRPPVVIADWSDNMRSYCRHEAHQWIRDVQSRFP